MKLYKSSDKSNFGCSGFAIAAISAVCPGGEGAVLKIVGCKRLAGSNPVYGACYDDSRLTHVVQIHTPCR